MVRRGDVGKQERRLVTVQRNDVKIRERIHFVFAPLFMDGFASAGGGVCFRGAHATNLSGLSSPLFEPLLPKDELPEIAAATSLPLCPSCLAVQTT